MRPDHGAAGINPAAPLAAPVAAGANNVQPVDAARPGSRVLHSLASGLEKMALVVGIACGGVTGFGAKDPIPRQLFLLAMLLKMCAVWLHSLTDVEDAGLLGHPELREPAPAREINDFRAPGSPAGRFDWNEEPLIVDSEGRDMIVEVTHLLDRAFADGPAPLTGPSGGCATDESSTSGSGADHPRAEAEAPDHYDPVKGKWKVN